MIFLLYFMSILHIEAVIFYLMLTVYMKPESNPNTSEQLYGFPRLKCQTEVNSDQNQMQSTPCVSRPKLRGLGFGSSKQYYDQRSMRPGDGLIGGFFRLGFSDQRWTQAPISLIR